jgi:DNA-binding SARP family transcriptional activator/WD40 repeat protein/tRNA A-37 threonylcarbamoyl transferase component Bud32/type II secretory pathway predicted ATPase ExeA
MRSTGRRAVHETRDVTVGTAVCFTVLRGTVGAADQGEPIALGGPQQRRLLAALLVDHDSVVSVDRLVESVWTDGTPPDGARRTVMTYVSRLRATIGGDHVVTHDHGYELVLGGGTYDARDFETALTHARGCGPDEGVAAYDRALALWSGRAFGEDADEWWLRPIAARLEELRLVALEERADLLIDTGRHTEAVADLEQLVVEQPLRERFVELLMRALYLGGRQAEALRAFVRYRDYLADETGLVPSDGLADLEHRITLGDPSLAPSTEIAVPGYELGEVIGEGAFGAVYRAVQPTVGREVAVKVVRAELADDPRFVQRFEAEAQLVARLEHPHVVPLYDYWRRPGGAFLVFRLLRGGSLAERIADGPLPLADVSRMVAEISSALGAAHALGVVHRDVKPANVLFDDLGNSYLADFGIAVVAEGDEELDLRSAGSPLYASPEQVRDTTASPASDQYSFAVVVWEALTGRAPFAGATVTEMLRTKLAGALPALPEPAGLDAVLRRATAPHPADRYAHVDDFARAWELAVADVDGMRTTGRLSGETPRRQSAHTMARLPAIGANPYKGLRAFREADAAEFHGRRALVAQLVEAIDDRALVAVVGPSGSGKSSLVHAGAVPALRGRGDLVVSMVPGTAPLAELEAALRRVATTADVAGMRSRLAEPDGLVALAADLTQDGERLVLVVDQFEELWTLVDVDAEREQFATLLAHATDTHDALRVVVTLRADLYDRPLQHPSLGQVVRTATFAVTPMTSSELEEAIVEPAERVGVRFEPGLVATMVGDVVARPGALPLLQFTLAELYERRTNATVTAAAYAELGGIGGALASRAEQLYAESDPEERAQIRSLFTQLVTIGDDGDDLRRRATTDELGSVTPAVIERYRANRLLVTDHHPVTRQPTAEVAHEALLREWPRLRDWVEEDRDAIRFHRSVTEAAHEWQRQGRDESGLYRGPRLAVADEIAARMTLGSDARDFLAASHELADRERDEADRRAAHQVRQNRRLRRLLAATVVVSVMALVFGGYAIGQRDRADRQRTQAQSATASAQLDRALAEVPTLPRKNRTLALLLAAQAHRLRPDAASRTALFDALTDEPRLRFTMTGGHDGVFGVAPLPAARLVTMGRTGGDVWDVRRRRHVGTVALGARATAVAASPDGKRLAFADQQGRVTFWDASTLRRQRAPIRTGAPVADLVFSADGSRLTIALGLLKDAAPMTAATTPRVWDVRTRTPTGLELVGHATTVMAVARNGTDTLVAAGDSGGHVVLHDAGTGRVVSDVVVGAGVTDVAFSPDGRQLGVGTSGGGFGVVYDVTEPTAPRQATPHLGNGVSVGVAFDAQTSWFAVSGDYGAQVFDPTQPGTPQVGAAIESQHGPARVAFVPGAGLVVTGYDGTITGWDPTGDPLIARKLPDGTRAGGTVSPDGTRVAFVDNADTVRLGRWPDLHPIATLSVSGPGERGPLHTPTPAAFSPDGRELAVGNRAGYVRRFDARTGRALGAPILAGSPNLLIVALGYSPDGRMIATSSFDDTENGAHVIDVASGRATPLDPPVPFAFTSDFSPDGRRLVATSGAGDLAAVYPIRRGRVGRGKLVPAGENAIGAAFSPDGSLLAVTRTDGRLAFFDARTMRPSGTPLTLTSSILADLIFSPNGDMVLVQDLKAENHLVDVREHARVGDPIPGSAAVPPEFGLHDFTPDGKAMLLPSPRGAALWDLAPTRWLRDACTLAGRDLTPAEWRRYFSAFGRHRSTCA